MKTTPIPSQKLPAVVGILTIGLLATSHGATLTQETTVLTNNQNSSPSETFISVTPGSESFGGSLIAQTAFNAPVAGYTFINRVGNSLNEYASSGGLVSSLSVTNISVANSYIDLYTTTNPNNSGTFDAPADFTTNTDLAARIVTGSVDLSSLTSGSVYFFFGTFADNARVTATLTGSASADIVVAGDDLTATGYAMTRFDFDTTGGYDTLDFEYLNDDNDGSPGSRGRISGLVVTAVPEPSAALLGALGVFALIRRRR